MQVSALGKRKGLLLSSQPVSRGRVFSGDVVMIGIRALQLTFDSAAEFQTETEITYRRRWDTRRSFLLPPAI